MSTIRQIDVLGVSVPLAGAFKSALGVATTQRSVIVRMTLSTGEVGVGNVDPAPGFSMETVEEDLQSLTTRLAPGVLGLDGVLAAMDRAMDGYLEAKAAIEMAAIDAAARRAALPVHAYLGGALKETVSFNAWIGMLAPEAAAEAARAWVSRGFRSAKVKIGSDDTAGDLARVEAVRKAAGPAFKIRVDANCHYTTETALEVAKGMAPLDVELFEQPIAADDLDALARVRHGANKLGLPIMADEAVTDHASLMRIIKAGAADLVKLKVMKQGGLIRTSRMIATAEAAGMRCVVGHGFGLSINTMAELMLAATSNAVLDALECVGPLATKDDVVRDKLNLSKGTIPLPSGLGFGLVLDDAKMEQYGFFAKRIS